MASDAKAAASRILQVKLDVTRPLARLALVQLRIGRSEAQELQRGTVVRYHGVPAVAQC